MAIRYWDIEELSWRHLDGPEWRPFKEFKALLTNDHWPIDDTGPVAGLFIVWALNERASPPYYSCFDIDHGIIPEELKLCLQKGEELGLLGEKVHIDYLAIDPGIASKEVQGQMVNHIVSELTAEGFLPVSYKMGRSIPPERFVIRLPERPTGTPQPKWRARAPMLSFADAAEQILLQSEDRQPLKYQTITERAIDQGLIKSQGRTPARTMFATLSSDIRRRKKRQETQRFVRHAPGMFGLASWVPVSRMLDIEAIIRENNRKVRETLLAQVHKGSSDDFEALVGELLRAIGFENVEVTGRSNDGGIDARGTMVVGKVMRTRMAIQAKCWRANVQKPVVQQMRGALGAHEQGLIITTSDFSKGAKEEATRSDAAPVALMNGPQLAALLAEHELGTQAQRCTFFTLDNKEK